MQGIMKTKLKRDIHPMPGHIRQTLKKEGLWEAYKGRPAYQQNDYVGWISQAKQEATKEKRLKQMVGELKKGGVYMRMKWNGKKPPD
jgi:uncharacterized protein YdeI (YjbR/CyaY-like superfamily)